MSGASTAGLDGVARPGQSARRAAGAPIDRPGSGLVTATPQVSVIVPMRDAEATLAEQLEALATQDFVGDWELILADNGSRDRSLEVARRFADRLPLRIVDAAAVRGTAHARNVGARAARAPLLAFVDADDAVAPDWLRAIVDALGQHTVVASRFDREHLNPPELRATRGLSQEVGLGRHDYAPFLPHAGGSGLGVRRTAHDQVGGFDERLRKLQDTDYAWRLQLDGHAIHFEPSALVHVRFRSTLAAMCHQSFGYGRHSGWLYHRYGPHGMRRVPLLSHLRRLLVLLVRFPGACMRGNGARHLRALANSLGLLIGRLEGRWRLR